MVFQKGHPTYVSKETYTRMAQLRRGHVVTQETRDKISLTQMGKPKSTSCYPRSEETKQRMSEAKRKQWQNPIYRERMLANLRRASNNLRGTHQSPEFIEKRMSKLRGRKNSPATLLQMRESAAKRETHNWDNTSIERAVQAFLTGKIEFVTQHPIQIPDGRWHRADIFIPSKSLIVECDGDYWHARPQQRAWDIYFDRKVKDLGLTVVRLSESDINKGNFTALTEHLK